MSPSSSDGIDSPTSIDSTREGYAASSVQNPLIDLQLSAPSLSLFMSPQSSAQMMGASLHSPPANNHPLSRRVHANNVEYATASRAVASAQDAVRSWQSRRRTRVGAEDSSDELSNQIPVHRSSATAGETIQAFHRSIRSKPPSNPARPRPARRQSSPTANEANPRPQLTPEEKVAKQATLAAEGRVQELVPGSLQHLARLNRECTVNGKAHESKDRRERHEHRRQTKQTKPHASENSKYYFGNITAAAGRGTIRNVAGWQAGPSPRPKSRGKEEDGIRDPQQDQSLPELSSRALVLLHSLT